MAKLIKSNGEIKEVQPRNGKCFTLSELQGFVDGYIEFVNMSDDVMVVNEEGKLLNLPVNTIATELYAAEKLAFDIILGDVLLCKRNQL